CDALFFFSSRRRHTRCLSDWSSDVCSSDLGVVNSRYTFVLAGPPDPLTGKREVRLQSWEGKRRVNVGAEFDWTPDTWYTVKLTRSEERRVGKWGRARRGPDQGKDKKK